MIWLIGAGRMAIEYTKVLNALNKEFIVIGRSENSARLFKEKTGKSVVTGGLKQFIKNNLNDIPQKAIIACNVEELANVANLLLDIGSKDILVEKPGGTNAPLIAQLDKRSKTENASIQVAYNRRFYTSAYEARRIIVEDGGVDSFNFEFTELSAIISESKKDPEVKQNWFLANSTHVADLAFHLGGLPKEMESYSKGKLDWHPSASCFAGAGVADSGALFSYCANWAAPGRWNIEIVTQRHRLVFCPMEKLRIQEHGSMKFTEPDFDYTLDNIYKPGLYRQTMAYLENDKDLSCSIQEQAEKLKIYRKMANY